MQTPRAQSGSGQGPGFFCLTDGQGLNAYALFSASTSILLARVLGAHHSGWVVALHRHRLRVRETPQTVEVLATELTAREARLAAAQGRACCLAVYTSR
jgi:hypothetical protein